MPARVSQAARPAMIVDQVMQGKTNYQIAYFLGVGNATITNDLARIYRQRGINLGGGGKNRRELVRQVRRERAGPMDALPGVW